MDFDFTDDLAALREAVQRWVDKGFGFARRQQLARAGGRTREVWAELAGLGLTYLLGVGFMLQFTQINTLLQVHVDDEMRGRVLSLYTLTFFGFAPFGNLLVGALAEWIGLSIALVVMAAVTLLSAIVIFWKTPQLRHLP